MTHLSSSSVPARSREPYTRRALHEDARELHQAGVRVFNPGWLCVIAAIGLSVVGISAIGTTETDYAVRQVMHLCIGLVAAAVVAVPHYRWLDWFSYPFLAIALLLLVFVLIPAVPDFIVRPRNNARRWINLVVMDFQPSELAKIAYVLALATYLKYRRSYRTFFGVLLPLAATAAPMGLILVEPDLGTSLLFVPTLFAMLIAAGAKLKHLILIAGIGMSAAPMMYPMLKSHQKNRIKALVAQVTGDSRYEDDIGYQGAKAKMLVGSGQFVGSGKEHSGDLLRFNSLPEEHNDMIFAVVGCRWGFLGVVSMWALYGLFALGGVLIAAQTKDPFGRLVPIGLTAVILAQMFINCGMTLGLLPITGMTLPFVSYGGSSLLSAWLTVGLLFNIALRRPQFMMRESFNFDRIEADG